MAWLGLAWLGAAWLGLACGGGGGSSAVVRDGEFGSLQVNAVYKSARSKTRQAASSNIVLPEEVVTVTIAVSNDSFSKFVDFAADAKSGTIDEIPVGSLTFIHKYTGTTTYLSS